MVGLLDAAADLHRAVTFLWEGVGKVLPASLPDGEATIDEGKDASHPWGLTKQESTVVSTTERVSRMLQDQESLNIPMHLEDLPLTASTQALTIDVSRVQASTSYLIAVILAAGTKMISLAPHREDVVPPIEPTSVMAATSPTYIKPADEDPVIALPQFSEPDDSPSTPPLKSSGEPVSTLPSGSSDEQSTRVLPGRPSVEEQTLSISSANSTLSEGATTPGPVSEADTPTPEEGI